MRYLITGAAGFLGSALANRLVKDGHVVYGLDDLSTGDAGTLVKEVRFTKGDVRDKTGLWNLLREIDCVYHLAARVSVSESVLYPSEYTAVNVMGTVNLMEAMRDVGVRRAILASSGAVYGDQDAQPVVENAEPHPRSPYAVSKLSAEYYVRTIGSLWGIETVCLRIFNAYGPGQRIPVLHAPVIPSCLRNAIQNGTIVVHGDGKQTRDYIYVDDVVNALVSASTAEGVNNRIINIGSGTETSVRSIIQIVMEITGGHPEVVYNPRNDGGPSRLCADLTLAKQKLNYTPRTNLTDGLRFTLEKDPHLSLKMNEKK
jgi:UDP-glucose 4-epimerase